MFFNWEQMRSGKGEPEKWRLIHKETKRAVLFITISDYGETYDNAKVRRQIKAAYERYYLKVWYKTLLFF